jgi:hypothetical protein
MEMETAVWEAHLLVEPRGTIWAIRKSMVFLVRLGVLCLVISWKIK